MRSMAIVRIPLWHFPSKSYPERINPSVRNRFFNHLASAPGAPLVQALVLCGSLLGSLASIRADEPVSFRNDVMAILSKAGCNAGQCHGNARGKAGFKLSLRGESPDLDYFALTHDQFNRRMDLIEPAQSLMLLKPTMQLAHEGGLRFKTNSW